MIIIMQLVVFNLNQLQHYSNHRREIILTIKLFNQFLIYESKIVNLKINLIKNLRINKLKVNLI